MKKNKVLVIGIICSIVAGGLIIEHNFTESSNNNQPNLLVEKDSGENKNSEENKDSKTAIESKASNTETTEKLTFNDTHKFNRVDAKATENQYAERRKKILESMDNNSMMILFAGNSPKKSNDYTYNFTVNKNFYYLTGINQEFSRYIAVKDNEGEIAEFIFISEPNEFQKLWYGETLSLEEGEKISGINNVIYSFDYRNTYRDFLAQGIDTIYLDLEENWFDDDLGDGQNLKMELEKSYDTISSIVDIYPKITKLRGIKNQEEIDFIRKATDITEEGIKSMMKNASVGMMEYELEAYFDFALTSNGVKEPAFRSIVAGGSNSNILHYEHNEDKIEDGELVLCDLGAEVGNYATDVTRTFPINGKFTEEQKAVYNLVLKAQNEILAATKPGASIVELNNIYGQVIKDGLIELGYIDANTEFNIQHSASHHVGLDVHDPVDMSNLPFEAGMVLAIEPGIYLLDENIGIRIEDTVLITEDGYEILSKDIPKTVEEIEDYMAK